MFRELVFVICVFTRNPFQPDSITKNVIIRYISICMFYKILHKPRTWLCEFTKAVFPLLQVTWRKCFVRRLLFLLFIYPPFSRPPRFRSVIFTSVRIEISILARDHVARQMRDKLRFYSKLDFYCLIPFSLFNIFFS